MLAPVRHSYKSAGINQLASSPLSSSGSRAGGTREAPILYMRCLSLFSWFPEFFDGPNSTVYLTVGPVEADKLREQYNKRDRARRGSSARACAFRFVSTIRLKVKS